MLKCNTQRSDKQPLAPFVFAEKLAILFNFLYMLLSKQKKHRVCQNVLERLAHTFFYYDLLQCYHFDTWNDSESTPEKKKVKVYNYTGFDIITDEAWSQWLCSDIGKLCLMNSEQRFNKFLNLGLDYSYCD